MKFWYDGAIDGIPANSDRYLPMGHETSGIVVDIGPTVQSLKVGDRVAIEPARPCRTCVRCREGTYNLCPDMRWAGSCTEDPGTLAKFYCVPADFCYRLPDHISMEEGVLAEPLAVAAHQVKMAQIKPGQSLVIFGAGTIGIACAAVAKMYGARKIIAVDLLQSKLDFVQDLLGCRTFKPETSVSFEETASQIIRQAGLGLGADAVIEASGSASCLSISVHVLRKGGHLVQTGIGKHVVDFPIFLFTIKELHMHGAFRHSEGDYRVALDALENNLFPVKTWISQIFDFEDHAKAWEATSNGQGIKNMIKVIEKC